MVNGHVIKIIGDDRSSQFFFMPRLSKRKKQVAAASEARRKKKPRLRDELNEVDHSGDDFDCGFDVNEDNSQVIGEDYENAWHKLMKASKTWVNKNKRLSVYVGNSRTTK